MITSMKSTHESVPFKYSVHVRLFDSSFTLNIYSKTPIIGPTDGINMGNNYKTAMLLKSVCKLVEQSCVCVCGGGRLYDRWTGRDVSVIFTVLKKKLA